jgi:UDP-2-acetamido-2,6-beta-L-arabino-hexul-4-ose reductase
MNVLIIGKENFIGKNLFSHLNNFKRINILNYYQHDSKEEIFKKIKNSDLIIFIPYLDSQVENKFLKSASEVVQAIKKLNKKLPIIYISHSIREIVYFSKIKNDEKILLNFFKYKQNPITIFRVPKIFGKWCEPEYSDISKIIYAIIKNKKLSLKNSKTKVDFVYIDNLIELIIKELFSIKKDFLFKNVGPIYSHSLKEIFSKVSLFKKNISTINVQSVGTDFDRALYSTFISYFSPKNYINKLKIFKDKRGEFLEILKTENSGQFSFFTITPKKIRGEHYHNTKFEKFLVVKGRVLFKFKHLFKNKIYKIFSTEKNFQIINTIPGWVHSIENCGSNKALIFVWSNEVFNVKKPDTIFKKIVDEKT